MAKPKTSHSKLAAQFIKYAISGGAYFWSGYLIFFVCYSVLHWNLWWAKLSANIIGWIVNFSLQRYWAFSNPELKKHQTQVTGRYAVITLVDFVLDYLIVSGLKTLGLTPYLGQFVSAGFFGIWNFLWYRYWVFPEKFTKKSKRVHTVRVGHRPHGHGAYRTS
ncbi:MAG TPA: GtrA family protein [Candidatus Binatia bacterium]|nr:GtrA family protein [Candidatus Binatia bacterium]